MAITVKHKFVSAIPDAGDTTIVQPSNWNDDHQLVGTIPVSNGGTGAATLTGYVKGNGTANMTAATTIPNTDVTGLGTASTKDAGVALGVATLDAGGTVPLTQIPASIIGGLNYQGTWNASTNTPTLTSSVGTKGYYYAVSVAGSTNLNGITDWQINDLAVYSGTVWQKIDNTDAVTSVNGLTGAVVLNAASVGAVSSVALSAPSFLSVSGSPVTSTGTLALTYSGTALPVANGGTGVTASSGANSVVLRDANQNIAVNAIFEGFSVLTASSPIVLTASSAPSYVITGSGGQTIQLPNATTLSVGASFAFNNNQTSGAITVNNNSVTLIVSIPSGAFTVVTLLTNGTAAGTWDYHDQAPSNVSWSTNTFSYAGSITNATWNGNTIATNRGGTGLTTVGTAGQVLTSNGTTLSYTTPTTGTVTSVTGTAPIVSSGGATPAISMAAATTSVNGYLTSTDWNTFNNKGSGSVTSITAGTGLTGGTITSSGTIAIDSTVATLTGTQSLTNKTFDNTNTVTLKDTLFTLQDDVDTTKRAQFQLSGLITAATVTYSLPAGSSGASTLVDSQTAQNINGNKTFSNATSSFGTSTAAGTYTLGSGATISGATRTINIGNAGVAGSTTAITIGGTAGTNNITANGVWTYSTPMAATNMVQATTSTSGYLSNTDWNTFNGKAPSVTYTTNYVPYGQGTTTPALSANFQYDPTLKNLIAPQIRASNGIIVNSKTVSANFTVASGDSAMSSGPITINSGVTVTISSGSRWVVL